MSPSKHREHSLQRDQALGRRGSGFAYFSAKSATRIEISKGIVHCCTTVPKTLRLNFELRQLRFSKRRDPRIGGGRFL